MGSIMRIRGAFGFFLLVSALPLAAGEYAVLRNGYRMRVERHEITENGTRLYLPGGGWVDVRIDDIARLEPEEPVAAPPMALAPVAVLSLTDIVRESSRRNGLDPDLIHSVIAAESAGNPRAVSPKGAAGLMQLMPGTASLLNVTDVFDPTQNVEAGTKYLRRLLDQYGHDLGKALAAYNAGPGKVDAYNGVPPYRETRDYVGRVIRKFNAKKSASR